ncbi:hypothetical protein QQS21_009683 [Conoideocrella luteorostrata]|uniref:Ima1 N-terminal domain-containing protein n=1 Tax=Conoideocrella luteorostrata TaxID=1105319 RepID=A0AAJ0FVE9_9HYPO|nr:hypothetical protein QQS21_009683 [Conoideocrella luteorostrata]
MKFDGSVRDFLCLHCDATNYLDQNGEITDPPVATDRETATVQFAAPQSSVSTPQDDIFCQTCLKNQHLFTKSLAQYFPDDPSDPDYPELERNYYRYRKNLENRYPQVCGACAERAENRIRQAGYTAKTDHLRRMMNLSRGRKTRTRTKLDWFNTLGKSLWRTGFVLQILWHFHMITQALQLSDNGMYDPDDQSMSARVVLFLQRAAAFLPAADSLIQWSIRTGILAAWWNPHFVQVNRGFTRHLLGFTQWYSLQGVTIFFRFIFRGLDVNSQMTQSGTARLGAHAAMAAVMIGMYVLAGRSIQVDTTPLFVTYNKPLVPGEGRSPRSTKQSIRQDSKTFSELFNDALDSVNATPQKSVIADMTPSPQSPFQPPRPMSSSLGSIGNTGLTKTPTKRPQQQQQLQYDEEMDWSPITPQHRALNNNATPTPNRAGQFNDQRPSHQEPTSPFWYKVPAAPLEPARRMRNPVWPSVPKQVPVETGNAMFTRRGHKSNASQASIGSDASGGVEFKQPSFFAPERDHDASSLADLLSQSFTLGQEQEKGTENPRIEQVGQNAAPISQKARGKTKPQQSRIERVILTILVSLWLLVMFVPIPYRWEIQLATLPAAGVIALRGTGDSDRLMSHSMTPGFAILLSALSVAELAAICWVGSEVWSGRSEQAGWYGLAALASMLGHQTVSTMA